MFNVTRKSILFIMMIAVFVLAGCGGSDTNASNSAVKSGGNNSSSGCAWHANCSTRAPEGAYDCSGGLLIMQCIGGTWKEVAGCSMFTNSDGYYCNCKGGCGNNTTECSYAFEVCGGQEYPTCGPNATPVMTDIWSCQ